MLGDNILRAADADEDEYDDADDAYDVVIPFGYGTILPASGKDGGEADDYAYDDADDT